jgi:hypothetical protein
VGVFVGWRRSGQLWVRESGASNIVVIGNSTSVDGTWVDAFKAAREALGDTVQNSSEGGVDLKQFFLNNTTNFAARVTAKKSSTKRNVILCFEGNYADNNYNNYVDGALSPGNGFTTGSQAWPIYASFADKCRNGGGAYGAGGWLVYMATLDIWNDAEQPQPGYRNYLNQLNAHCRSRVGLDYDKLLDIDATGHWDPFNDHAPPYYDGGGVHKTTAGYAQMAADFLALYAAAG